MNNTSNRPFGLSKPPTEDFIRVVRELDAITTRLAIPFLLVGAAARDVVLVNLWGQPPGRATADMDFERCGKGRSARKPLGPTAGAGDGRHGFCIRSK